MWLRSVEKDDLDRLIREGQCCQISAGLDGEIFWASDAMCEWSGYTLYEIMRLGWIKLSVDDENLAADISAAQEMKSGLRSEYQVEKKYRKKSGAEYWGLLHVKRVPASGEFKYAWCHWTPFHNGTQIAFEKALEFQMNLEKRVAEMTTEIRRLTEQSEDDKWVIASMRMMQRHPKLTMAAMVIMLSIFGANNILELMQRTGVIQIPVTVKATQ
jgi:PAS domain S-box-containing protein